MGFAIKFYLFHSTPTLPIPALKTGSSKPLLRVNRSPLSFRILLTLLTLYTAAVLPCLLHFWTPVQSLGRKY